jgi:hypothetical protein
MSAFTPPLSRGHAAARGLLPLISAAVAPSAESVPA